MSPDTSTCKHCGKPLTDQMCYACNGSGIARELAFLKRECEVCGGKGRVWRCEDEFKHIVDDFKATHDVLRSPARPPRFSHAKEAKESSPPQSLPWQSINPENPWNSNVLNVPLKTAKQKVKNPGQQVSRKSSHKK